MAAALTVNSRAISSNEAGSVRTNSCSASGCLGNRASQASRTWARYAALTSTGESRSTSAAPCHGSSGAVRSTPEWHSHDLAELTNRPGASVP